MAPFFTSSSKAEFERQLNRARPADLIESVHAAQTVIKGCGGQPEAPYAAGHLVVGRTKIAVIKYIEELAAELQIDAFREIELNLGWVPIGVRGYGSECSPCYRTYSRFLQKQKARYPSRTKK
jgi:hypothetical protein